jgi:hypothetical protein
MKTAVEQLERQILDNWMDILRGKVYIGDLFEQAKEMEKEQIYNAWMEDRDNITYYKDGSEFEQYYSKTFNQQEQCKCGQPKVGGYSCQRTDCNQNL